MSEQIDLKGLEKKAWRSTYQDGIWDIYFGMLILGMALAPYGENFGLPSELGSMIVVFCIDLMAVIFLILGKKYITIPRIGFVKFGVRRKRIKKYLLGFLIFNLLLAFVFLFADVSGIFNFFNIEGIIRPLVVGLLLITVPLSLLAYFLGYQRLYIYAIFFGLGLFFSDVLYPFVGSPLDLLLGEGLTGIVAIIIGLAYLVKFLHKYPISKK